MKTLTTILIIVLGIQIYLMMQLNDRLDQLSRQDSQVNGSATLPTPPERIIPKLDPDDKLAKEQPWSPYEEMQRLQNKMERIFEDSFSRFHLNTSPGSFSKTPDVDFQERSDRYIVTINVPGANINSLETKLENRKLYVSIETEHSEDKDNGEYKYRERFRGEFRRVLTLPGPVDAAQMTTDYRNGVLAITIPKA